MRARSLSGTRFRSRQAGRNIAARRARFVARIEAMPDAPGRWEFLFTIAPLRVQGGTGSPVNPIAVF